MDSHDNVAAQCSLFDDGDVRTISPLPAAPEDDDLFQLSRSLHGGDGCRNQEKDIDRMRAILDTDPASLDRRDSSLSASEPTPLHDACMKGHHNCVAFLLSRGADVNAVTRDHFKDALNLAIDWCQPKIVQTLLDHGVSPNYTRVNPLGHRTYNKSMYLMSALMSPCIQTAELLVKYGASINDFDGYDIALDRMDFFVAASEWVEKKDLLRLKFLLINGAPVDSRGAHLTPPVDPVLKDCLSLVHHANCSNGDMGLEKEKLVLQLLYQFGANFWERNRFDKTPLQMRSNRKMWLKERRARSLSWYSDRRHEGIYYYVTEYIKELMETPLSLSSLSRLALLKAMSPGYSHKLEKLPPLPERVKAFLRYDEFLTDSGENGQD